MKNKKLFAILTLVAFMMTLLPVAAFADTATATQVNANINRNSSFVKVDDTTLEANAKEVTKKDKAGNDYKVMEGDEAEFTVYVRDKNNKATYGSVYVASDREDTDFITGTKGAIKTNVQGHKYVYEFPVDKNGKVEFEVRSSVSGEAKIGIATQPTLYTYLTKDDESKSENGIIDVKTLTFEATDDQVVRLAKVEAKKGDEFNFFGQDTDSDADDYDYEYRVFTKVADERTVLGLGEKASNKDILDAKAKFVGKEVKENYTATEQKAIEDAFKAITETNKVENSYATEYMRANGSDYYEVTFSVENITNVPIEDETVEISANKNDVTFNKDEVDSDEAGEATFKVYADKPGTYEVEGSVGSEKATVFLTFEAAGIDDVELASDVDELVATDAKDPASFKIEFKDANGNKINPENYFGLDTGKDGDVTNYGLKGSENYIGDEIDVDWLTLPEDCDFDDDNDEITDFNLEVTSDELLKVYIPELDEEGKYELKLSVGNGNDVKVNFEGREQGDVTKLTLEYDQETIQLGAETGEPTVKQFDADGVSVETTKQLKYTLSDYKIASVNDNGVVTATTDEDYTGEIVVTVIDEKEDLTASTTITVGQDAVGFDLEAPEVVTVGEEGKVKLTLKDRDGNVVAFGDAASVKFDYYVTAEPEKAKASADEANNFSNDIQEKGIAYVDVEAQKEGNVTYTFLVTIERNEGNYETDTNKNGLSKEVKFSKSVTVNFGEKAPEIEGAAKTVNLIINNATYTVDGAMKTADVAPFIENGRTFVPVRMVGEALGAEVEYDQATQTVTLAREDKTITMTVGQNTLTVSDGDVVVSDVAPFIKDGRTVLPFRAIGEAFGADVEAVFNADGSVAGVTFSQK